MQNFFTLDKVIRALLVKSGEDSEHKYGLYNTYACDYLNDFVNNTSREIRTVRLEMGTDRAVNLPPDFVDWVKVGTEQNGSVKPMSYNTTISKLSPQKAVSGNMLNYKDSVGNHCGELPCSGTFDAGADFSIDHARKIMRFSSLTNVADVYLEYISSAVDVCGDTPIHPYIRPTLESYIKWKEAEFKGGGQTTYWRNEYYNEKRKLAAAFSPFSLEMLHDIIESHYSLNVR
jgi:hypothetical protein